MRYRPCVVLLVFGLMSSACSSFAMASSAMALSISSASSISSVMPEDTPQVAAVREMKKLADAKEWKKLYDELCHPHLQRQLTAEEFAKYMEDEKGKRIVRVLSDVLTAVDANADEATLLARPEEKDQEAYEFILVKVQAGPRPNGQQWHLELKLEGDKWKLMDTD